MKIAQVFYGAVLIGLSACTYAAEYCPAVDTIQYDANSSKYVNTAGDLKWSSAVMAVSTPTPTITFKMVISNGAVKDSTISCNYSDGNNYFTMDTGATFSIDSDQWTQINPQSYYCKRSIADCEFSLNDSKTKKKI